MFTLIFQKASSPAPFKNTTKKKHHISVSSAASRPRRRTIWSVTLCETIWSVTLCVKYVGQHFMSRTHLTHIAFKHNDSRLFQCSMCEATFKMKNALKRLSLVHSEMKSHKCLCGVGFKRLTNLRRHMMRIHGRTDRLLPPVKRVKSLD